MQLLAVYVVLVVIGEFGAYLVGRAAENWWPTISLPLFLSCFFLVFWIAWLFAVKLTEPKTAKKPA
jgi:predicted membrane protein